MVLTNPNLHIRRWVEWRVDDAALVPAVDDHAALMPAV
jgi:hypothetical protein